MDPKEMVDNRTPRAGPHKRKSMPRMQSKRKNDITANDAELTDDDHPIGEDSVNPEPNSFDKHHLNNTNGSQPNASYAERFSREGSANRSRQTLVQDQLIDPDDSHSDEFTDEIEHTTERKRSDTPYEPEFSKIPNSTPDSGTGWIGMCCIVGIVIGLVALYLSGNSSNVRELDAIEQLQTSFGEVNTIFWDELRVNINRATSSESPEPGVILFLHYGSSARLETFIASVVRITAHHFGEVDPIVLNGDHLKQADIVNDYGVFLVQQKENLLRQGVMLVRNLENVPAAAARAFHTLCDTEEPLVERAVIYLTLDMVRAAESNKPSTSSVLVEAERTLRKLWKDSLPLEVLDPLITRLTGSVYRIVL